jgi:hypothetical protein
MVDVVVVMVALGSVFFFLSFWERGGRGEVEVERKKTERWAREASMPSSFKVQTIFFSFSIHNPPLPGSSPLSEEAATTSWSCPRKSLRKRYAIAGRFFFQTENDNETEKNEKKMKVEKKLFSFNLLFSLLSLHNSLSLSHPASP